MARHYSEFDCGGPNACSGCSSWRHGVYEDGSGDPEALAAMQRAKARRAKTPSRDNLQETSSKSTAPDNLQQIVDEMREHYAKNMGGIFEIASATLPAPLVVDVVPDGLMWLLKVSCGDRVLYDTGMAMAVKPQEFLSNLYVFVRACMKAAITPAPKPS